MALIKPRKQYPIYEPVIAKNQAAYVMDCVNSNWISSRGSYIDKFEAALAEYLGVKHVITTCNGSVSLMLILAAMDIKHKDEVITQSLTYAATVSSIANVGATPVLIDSNSNFQMDAHLIAKAVTKRTKAVLVAQLYGDSPGMYELSMRCADHNLPLIEDSAECFGSRTCGQMIGSWGKASSFSFFGNKIITTGEGGCVCTNDDELAAKMRLLKSQSHIGSFRHNGPGYNFRMTNIAAAIGLAQLEEVDSILRRKKEIADIYRNSLHSSVGRVVPVIDSNEWMPLFTLPPTITYLKFSFLCQEAGIDTRPCFYPVHLMDGFKFKCPKTLPMSSKLHESAFNLPCYPGLSNEDLDCIVKEVNRIVLKVG